MLHKHPHFKLFFKVVFTALLLLVVAWCVWQATFAVNTQKAQQLARSPEGMMEWLRHEYGLSDAQFAAIKKIHQESLPQIEIYGGLARLTRGLLMEVKADRAATRGELDLAWSLSIEASDDFKATFAAMVDKVAAEMTPQQAARYREDLANRRHRPPPQ